MEALRYGAITAVGFEFPEAARFLRLDPPAGSHLAYGMPRLAVLEDDRPIGIPIPVDGLQKSGLLIDEDSLHVQGSSDPWMIVPSPKRTATGPSVVASWSTPTGSPSGSAKRPPALPRAPRSPACPRAPAFASALTKLARSWPPSPARADPAP